MVEFWIFDLLKIRTNFVLLFPVYVNYNIYIYLIKNKIINKLYILYYIYINICKYMLKRTKTVLKFTFFNFAKLVYNLHKDNIE